MGHDHGSAADAHRGRLAAVLALSLAILVVEVIGSVVANSLALLADAGHVLTDVVGIALGVIDCHDLHAWTITSGMNVVSAHVVIAEDAKAPLVLDALETADRRRLGEWSHP